MANDQKVRVGGRDPVERVGGRVELFDQCLAAAQGVERRAAVEPGQRRLAERRVGVVVEIDRPLGVRPRRVAGAEHGVELRPEVAAVGAGPAQPLAVPGERRQHHVPRQVAVAADAALDQAADAFVGGARDQGTDIDALLGAGADPQALGLGHQVGHPVARLAQHPAMHRCDPVADAEQLGKITGDDENRLPAHREVVDELINLRLACNVDPARRLIE